MGVAIRRLLGRVASSRAAGPARRLLDRALGRGPRVVTVLLGAARGARLELDLQSEKAYWIGHYESALQDLLREEVRPGTVFYDVGAHHGFLSVCAARLGARVYAFEPSPDNARRIRRNAELNGLPIEVVEAAAWDDEGGASLRAGRWDSEWRTVPGGPVRTVALDDFAASHPAPDLLKIDVEGAEVRVLRGARRLLSERPPVVVCELHGEREREDAKGLLSGHDVAPLASEWRLVARPRG